jgi:outer membrane protein assembly factor BamB
MKWARWTALALLTAMSQTLVSTAGASVQIPASNWPQRRYDARQSGFNPTETVLTAETVANLHQKWVLDESTSQPVVWKDSLYVSAGPIQRIDIGTGAVVWSTDATGFYGIPAVSYGRVYDGAGYTMYAFDALEGTLVWGKSAFYLGDTLASATVTDGTVFAGGYDLYANNSDFLAFDAGSGVGRWFDVREQRGTLYTPAVANGIVFLDGDNGYMDAATTDGVNVWSVWTGNYSASSPAVVGGRVYVGNSDGNLHAYDAATGAEVWATPVGTILQSSPAVAYGTVYIGSWENQSLFALDAITGAVRWSASTGVNPGSPVVAGGVVYVGDESGVHAFDAISGQELWNAPTPGEPVVANGMLFVGGDQLVAYGI